MQTSHSVHASTLFQKVEFLKVHQSSIMSLISSFSKKCLYAHLIGQIVVDGHHLTFFFLGVPVTKRVHTSRAPSNTRFVYTIL